MNKKIKKAEKTEKKDIEAAPGDDIIDSYEFDESKTDRRPYGGQSG